MVQMPVLLTRSRLRFAISALCALALAAAAQAGAAPVASAQGERLAPAIINGANLAAADTAPAGRWSHLAAVVSSGSSDAWYGQFCGGSLVAPTWVLTAAHCVFGDFDEDGDEEQLTAGAMDVVVGRHDLSASSGARIRVDLVVVPTEYPTTRRDDIALLRLTSPVPASTATPIAMVGAGDVTVWEPGDTLHIAGWGNQTATLCAVPGGSCAPAGAGSFPFVAAQASIPRIADATCGQGPAPGHPSFSALRSLCAGILDTDGAAGTTNGVDTCQGDSGGPLIADPGPGADARRLVGITSNGVGCGSTNYGFYTRLASYRDWVDGVMATNVAAPVAPQPTPPSTPPSTPSAEPTPPPTNATPPAPTPPLPELRGEPTAPGAPRSLRVVARTFSSITLAWDNPMERVGLLVGYEVSASNGTVATVAPNVTGYTLRALTPGRPVTISVRAFGEADESFSEHVEVWTSTVRDTVAPRSGAAPKVTRTRRGASIRWAAARDNHRVARYRVVARVGAAWKVLATVPATRRAVTLRKLPARITLIAIQPIDSSGNVGARSKPTRLR